MSRSTSTRAAICFASAIGFGTIAVCAQAASSNTASRTIQIGEFTGSVHVSLQPGDTLRVVLPSNPSTGYSWHTAGNSSVLDLKSSANTHAAGSNLGAPGKQTLTFTALTPGSDDLMLDYNRPWEKGKPAARRYIIAVTVGPAASTVSPVVITGAIPLGTYSGTLPCADCSGVLTSIALYALDSSQSRRGYYVQTSRYLGAPKGEVISIEAGQLTIQKGTPEHSDWIEYSLQSNTSDQRESYRLDGDTLAPLGSDGKPIQAPFNLSLKKQP